MTQGEYFQIRSYLNKIGFRSVNLPSGEKSLDGPLFDRIRNGFQERIALRGDHQIKIWVREDGTNQVWTERTAKPITMFQLNQHISSIDDDFNELHQLHLLKLISRKP